MAFPTTFWKTYVSDLRDRVDAESRAHRETHSPSAVTRRFTAVCLSSALILLFVRFAGDESNTAWAVDTLSAVGLGRTAMKLHHAMTLSDDKKIWGRVWWAAFRLVGYGVIPALIVKLGFRDKLRLFGTNWKGTAQHWRVYLTIFLVVTPIVFVASYGHSFQQKYPYYHVSAGEPLWPGFILWELLYAGQFIGLEFFFRGFIINGTRDTIGYSALLLPIMPYAMIHFQKPLPEAIGSIMTGIVLGTLCLKTRSIWGGSVLHITGACFMDWLSLWHRHLL